MKQMKDKANRDSNENFHISIIRKSPELEYAQRVIIQWQREFNSDKQLNRETC